MVGKTEATLLQRLADGFMEVKRDAENFFRGLGKEEMELLNDLKMEATEIEKVFGRALPLRKLRWTLFEKYHHGSMQSITKVVFQFFYIHQKNFLNLFIKDSVTCNISWFISLIMQDFVWWTLDGEKKIKNAREKGYWFAQFNVQKCLNVYWSWEFRDTNDEVKVCN